MPSGSVFVSFIAAGGNDENVRSEAGSEVGGLGTRPLKLHLELKGS